MHCRIVLQSATKGRKWGIAKVIFLKIESTLTLDGCSRPILKLKTSMKKSFLISILPVFLFFTACVSIERDLYFRDINSNVSWMDLAPRPGIFFNSAPIPLDNEASVSVQTEVVNRAEGSYFWGILFPVIPVFFLPEFKFKLNETERLKIRCSVEYSPGKKFLYKDPDREWYFLNEEGIRISNERRKMGHDICSNMTVTLLNGSILSPVSTLTQEHSTVFEFEIPIANLKEFNFNLTEIKLSQGTKKKVDLKFHTIFEDFLRYRIVPIGP